MQVKDQRQGEAEQFIGQILQTNWHSKQIDRQALAKRLILSTRQLNALAVPDPSAFHTYGIYIRALRLALGEAGLLNDNEVVKRIEFLEECYSRDPHMSRILEVKQTINRKLGVAPAQPGPEKPTDTRGVVALILVVSVVLALSLYVGLAT